MLNWDIHSLSLMRDDMVKEAERDHLAQEVLDEVRKSSPHYNPTLAWVGQRMIGFGQRLVLISGSEDDKSSLYKPDIPLN